MTTRRYFLSALVGLPLVGRLFPERRRYDLHPDMYRTSFVIPKMRTVDSEPTCRVCLRPLRLGEMIQFSGTWQDGPHLKCAEARRA